MEPINLGGIEMSTSSKGRRFVGLFATWTLYTSCILLTGCENLSGMFGPSKGMQIPEYPSFTRLVNPQNVKDGKTGLVFNWDRISIGENKLRDLVPKGTHWRVSLFNASTGQPVPNSIDSDKPLRFIGHDESNMVKLTNLPVEQMLRADIDQIISGPPENPTEGHSMSFLILLHVYPDSPNSN